MEKSYKCKKCLKIFKESFPFLITEGDSVTCPQCLMLCEVEILNNLKKEINNEKNI